MTFSFHCQSRMRRKSGGHGQVTQFGNWLPSLSPGQPEKVITRRTPIFDATCTVSRNCLRCRLATSGLGCSGLPWHDSALISSPRSSTFCFHVLSLPASASSSPGLQYNSPSSATYPPDPISTAVAPVPAIQSSASSNDSRS